MNPQYDTVAIVAAILWSGDQAAHLVAGLRLGRYDSHREAVDEAIELIAEARKRSLEGL